MYSDNNDILSNTLHLKFAPEFAREKLHYRDTCTSFVVPSAMAVSLLIYLGLADDLLATFVETIHV
jgi:hypothetical protein